MGNRAVIATRKKDIGVYLHWNGGRDSVEAFLTYCRIWGYRPPEQDHYGWARLCQIIGNFFADDVPDGNPWCEPGLSIGVDKYSQLDTDNGDNGVYVTEGWRIVAREFFRGSEQAELALPGMLTAIDEAQPPKMRFGTARLERELKKIREQDGLPVRQPEAAVVKKKEREACSSPESATSADAPSASSRKSSAKSSPRRSAKPAWAKTGV